MPQPDASGGSAGELTALRARFADLERERDYFASASHILRIPLTAESVPAVVAELARVLRGLVAFDIAVLLLDGGDGPHLFLSGPPSVVLTRSVQRKMVSTHCPDHETAAVPCHILPAAGEASQAAERRTIPRSEWFQVVESHGQRVGVLGLFSAYAHAFAEEQEAALARLQADLADLIRYLRDRHTREQRAADVLEHLEEQVAERTQQLVHQERMASLGVLSAGIAHEINNPTAFIRGNAQTMRNVWSTVDAALSGEVVDPVRLATVREEFPKMVAAVLTGTDRITAIVSGLRAFARQDTGEKEPLDLRAVVDDALMLTQGAIKDGITVEQDLPADPVPILGNRQQLSQVLVNLIVNAVHAMEPRTTKRLRITLKPATGDHVMLHVSDTGGGIPPELCDRIFHPFFTTKDVDKGTGLGLAVSQGIVDEHGGALTVESELGVGSTFSIELPAESEAVVPEAPAPDVELESDADVTASGAGILIIENERPVLAELSRNLTKAGYVVWACETAEEGLSTFAEEQAQVSLVICDLVMEDGDGVEVFRILTAQDPALPVVLMSAYCGSDQVAGLASEGLAGFLQKPVNRAELLRTVRHAVEASRGGRDSARAQT